MYCPKCATDMERTRKSNLYDWGDYICPKCKQKVSVYFEDIKPGMKDNEYLLTCTSCWKAEEMLDKYPVLGKYNTRIEDADNSSYTSRIIIEIDDLRKFHEDVKKDIIIKTDVFDGVQELEICDDYRE